MSSVVAFISGPRKMDPGPTYKEKIYIKDLKVTNKNPRKYSIDKHDKQDSGDEFSHKEKILR